jgi:hypothetical protein
MSMFKDKCQSYKQRIIELAQTKLKEKLEENVTVFFFLYSPWCIDSKKNNK